MHFWLSKFCFALGAIMFAHFAVAESEFSISYAGLELLETKQLEALSHPVLLSAPKRINNALQIEKQVKINGLRTNYLYRVKPGYDLDGAFAFYKDFLEANGSVGFECAQRNCGTSSDWANKVFSQSRLTGRDSNQAYIAGQVQGEGVHGWLSVYAVLSARRDEYVYVSFIPQKNGDLIAEFKRGRIILDSPLSQLELTALTEYLSENKAARVVLVSFHKDLGKTQAENEAESNNRAKVFSSKLESNLGALSDRLSLRSMGGLGQVPVGANTQAWMYLYLAD